jgi:hypothetical protein
MTETPITESDLILAGWTLNPARGFVPPGPGASLRVRLSQRCGWMAHGWNEATGKLIWQGVDSMERLLELANELRASPMPQPINTGASK